MSWPPPIMLMLYEPSRTSSWNAGGSRAHFRFVEWNYLNKGTHEEDWAGKFDAAVVRRMFETVMKLDEAIEAPQV